MGRRDLSITKRIEKVKFRYIFTKRDIKTK